MRKPLAIGASTVLALSLAVGGGALAQDSTMGSAKPPMTDSAKTHMGTGPAVQKSLPSSAPPATTTRMTGATNQDKTTKMMNSNEKEKVQTEGK
jgi:hypothetical protein